jgi:excinuclease ABC subunit A
VLYSGPPEGLAEVGESRTAQYLFGTVPAPRSHARTPSGWLQLEGIHRHNLHGLDARIPLGVLTAVTGISGSGKSSLIAQSLTELVRLHLGHEPEDSDDVTPDVPAAIERTRGHLAGDIDAVQRLVQVDQKPIGRTPRSNLATYTGLFDHVRKLFAATSDARRHRFDAGRFSFNVAKGRCETCEGEGFVSVELLFMPSVYAPCPTCHGDRYNEATLQVQWHDRNIAQVLRMTVEEASEFFAGEDVIARTLNVLREIGLGYLRLGQPATELQRSQRGRSLYVLDEPTTGLHAADVDRLMLQLHRLVDAGNTVVVIEHELRVIGQADGVIDMGPGAGESGGNVVAEGLPQVVARARGSRTAAYLAAALRDGAGAARKGLAARAGKS